MKQSDEPHHGRFVDLDALATAAAAGGSVRGVQVAQIKQSLGWWLTKACDFYFVKADKLRAVDAASFKLLTLQQMREALPDWLVRRTLDFLSVCRGKYKDDFLAVSHRSAARCAPCARMQQYHLVCRTPCSPPHALAACARTRWETKADPDPKCVQLRSLLAYLADHPECIYVFFDYMCLAQGERSPQDKADFQAMLPNFNMVYLGARVLVQMDFDYLKRFWVWLRAAANQSRLVAHALI